MSTLADLIGRYQVAVDDHHDIRAMVPVLTGLTRQGDVIVIPEHMAAQYGCGTATTPLPQAGFPVVRGESGGNTHLLLGEGSVFFDPAERVDKSSLDLGVLKVASGSTAYLAHPEHGFTGIGVGTYVIRRQREMADEIRMVAD